MTYFLKQNNKKFLAYYFPLIFSKHSTLYLGNLLLKLYIISILGLLLKNGSKHSKMAQNHAFYRMVTSDYFCLQRGCRQGDPISPYIFILCAEVLSHMIRKDSSINGVVIQNNEFKLSQYADDTQILDGTEISLRKTLQKLQKSNLDWEHG